jgi:segregation and condensation protein A
LAVTDPTLIPPTPPDDPDDAYQVQLPDFYGPMDLLLSLIEQEELEITEISLAQVTDQYLAYVADMQELTPDDLTDFLVLASRLILLKSQVLLPRPPASIIDDEEEDETDDLVQQLKDYKRFKLLAQSLGEIESSGQHSFIRIAPPPKIEPRLIPGEVSIKQLLRAVRRALAVKPEQPDVGTVVKRQMVTIGQQINRIRGRLNEEAMVPFGELLADSHSRIEVIVTLLALLELAKRRVLTLDQSQNFGEITVSKLAEAALSDADWSELSDLTDMS